MSDKESLPFWLTLSGTLPFITFSTLIAFDDGTNRELLLELLLSYAAVIFSFLAGIHWGLAVCSEKENSRIARYMMTESVIASLLAWGILFSGMLYFQLLAFAFLYAFIWGIDSLLFNHRIIPLWFFTLRGIVTPIVVVSMYVTYFSII